MPSSPAPLMTWPASTRHCRLSGCDPSAVPVRAGSRPWWNDCALTAGSNYGVQGEPFLLLSIRADDAAADNEYESFLSLAGLGQGDLRRTRLARRGPGRQHLRAPR